MRHEEQARFCRPAALEAVAGRIAHSNPGGGALCFLILSGAFNPVHTQHIVALEAARHHLNETGWQVVAGFLAPSSADHVRQKLGDRAMPLAKRIRLCELAVETLGWLEVCVEGEESSRWITRSVREELERSCGRQLNGRALTGVEVMGTDTIVRLFAQVFARRPTSADRVREPQRVVCYVERRIGVPTKAIDIERDFVPHAVGTRFIRVEPTVTLRPDEAVSSSAIRDRLANAEWDRLRESGWLHPAVLDSLQRDPGFSSV